MTNSVNLQKLTKYQRLKVSLILGSRAEEIILVDPVICHFKEGRKYLVYFYSVVVEEGETPLLEYELELGEVIIAFISVGIVFNQVDGTIEFAGYEASLRFYFGEDDLISEAYSCRTPTGNPVSIELGESKTLQIIFSTRT